MSFLIFLDANFLLIPAQFNLDIYEEFKRLVPKPWKIMIVSAIFTELECKIQKDAKKTKLRKEYALARQLLERHSYEVIERMREPSQLVDDLLLQTVIAYQTLENRVFLCTNDQELRVKSKKKGITTIYLRQQKFLAAD